jgi:hypothetical protein
MRFCKKEEGFVKNGEDSAVPIWFLSVGEDLVQIPNIDLAFAENLR